MPDGVSPTRPTMPKVEVVVEDVLVDICQYQLLLGAAQDAHADEADVGVLWLGLLRKGNPEESGIQLGHGEVGQVGGRAEARGEKVRWGLHEGGEGRGEGELQGGEVAHPVCKQLVVECRKLQVVMEEGRGS